MFLHGKKGAEDIVLTTVIVVVVAIIMIFLITSFGAKIWASLFPSGDKSTVKSFDAIFNVIDLDAASGLGYDMTPVSLYLKKGYCIVLFDAPTVSKGAYGVPGSGIYYAPEDCGTNQCMCLYDAEPKEDEAKKEKNLIKCDVFNSEIHIDAKAKPEYNFINPIICSSSGERYIPLAIVGNAVENVHYTYIIEDSYKNSALIEELKVPVCSTDSGMCSNKKNGTKIIPTDDEGLKKIQEFCTKDEDGNAHASTSVTCIYREGKNCLVDCASGDVSSECTTTYSSCESFNKIDGGITNYISLYNDYQYYYMCKNDAYYCKHGCQPNLFQVYASKNPDSRDGTVGQVAPWLGYPENYELLTRDKIKECKLMFREPRLPGGWTYLLSYDTSNQACIDIVETYFYPEKSTILTCRSEYAACQKLISDRGKECVIKYYSNGKYLWISYYEKNSDCDNSIKESFEEISVCGKVPQVVQVNMP